MIESKIYKHKRKPPSNICQTFFDNKAIQFIKLPRILHDPVVHSCIPSNTNNFDIPKIVFILEKTVHSRIFNFNTFVSNLGVDRFFQGNTILPYNSEGSEFIYQHHKHIFTGNLKILRDNKLRKLFVKRPRYQEKKTIYFEKAKLVIIADLNESIESRCIKDGYDKNLFTEWKPNVIQKKDSRIHHLSRKLNIKNSTCALERNYCEITFKSSTF